MPARLHQHLPLFGVGVADVFFSMDDYSPPSSPDASPRADSPTPTAFCDVSFVDESTVSGKFATLPARFHVYTHPQYHFRTAPTPPLPARVSL